MQCSSRRGHTDKFFRGKIYETQQSCLREMKADWLRVNNEQLTTNAGNAGHSINFYPVELHEVEAEHRRSTGAINST
jgi:hypothetical protein